MLIDRWLRRKIENRNNYGEYCFLKNRISWTQTANAAFCRGFASSQDEYILILFHTVTRKTIERINTLPQNANSGSLFHSVMIASSGFVLSSLKSMQIAMRRGLSAAGQKCRSLKGCGAV